jgi:hypothetical protein
VQLIPLSIKVLYSSNCVISVASASFQKLFPFFLSNAFEVQDNRISRKFHAYKYLFWLVFQLFDVWGILCKCAENVSILPYPTVHGVWHFERKLQGHLLQLNQGAHMLSPQSLIQPRHYITILYNLYQMYATDLDAVRYAEIYIVVRYHFRFPVYPFQSDRGSHNKYTFHQPSSSELHKHTSSNSDNSSCGLRCLIRVKII